MIHRRKRAVRLHKLRKPDALSLIENCCFPYTGIFITNIGDSRCIAPDQYKFGLIPSTTSYEVINYLLILTPPRLSYCISGCSLHHLILLGSLKTISFEQHVSAIGDRSLQVRTIQRWIYLKYVPDVLRPHGGFHQVRRLASMMAEY